MANFVKGDFFVVANKKHISGKTPQYRSVFMAMCSFADDEGILFPSRKTLATESGVSVKTLDRIVAEMVANALITKLKRKNHTSYTSNLYRIRIIDVGVASQTTLGSVTDDTRGSVTDDPITILGLNDIHLTITPDDKSSDVSDTDKKKNSSDYSFKVSTGKVAKKKSTYSPFGKKGSDEAILLTRVIDDMLESKDRAYQIVGAYISYREKSLTKNIRTKGQLYEFCQRHIKSANSLRAWDDTTLQKALDETERKHPEIDWTLETVKKELTK